MYNSCELFNDVTMINACAYRLHHCDYYQNYGYSNRLTATGQW